MKRVNSSARTRNRKRLRRGKGRNLILEGNRPRCRPAGEPLEPRLMLTGTDSGITAMLDQGELTAIDWQGQQQYAYTGQWVAHVNRHAAGDTATRDSAQPSLRDSVELSEACDARGLAHVESVRPLGVNGTLLVTTDRDVSYDQTTDLLRRVWGVEYIEPNFVLSIDDTVPGDPLFTDLWGMHNTGQDGGTVDADIDAVEAWDIATGSSDVVVAVIDTGVDYTHPDLIDNIWTNPIECPSGIGQCVADGFDNDGNGYVDDFHGIDTVYHDSDPFDGQRHGTHVSGTIAAVGDNGIGVAGVSWDAQVMALKFLNDSGSGSIVDAIEAIDYMVRMKLDYGVNVVASNNSWSGGGFSQALEDAIQRSVDAGILFVAAAGNASNNNDGNPSYPASYPLDGVVAVAATDRFDNMASFSNYGATMVDLGAPGVGIVSSVPGNFYESLNGTSMAAPHVTGAAALIAGAAPSASPAELKSILLTTVDPVPALQDVTVTGGRLNVHGALRQLGMRVVAHQPDPGQVLFDPPVEFTISLSDAVDPATVEAGDLAINGTSAETVAVADPTTLVFSYSTSPVTDEGLQSLMLAEGAVNRLSDGDLSQEYVSSFRYDATLLSVTATAPAQGTTHLLPFTTIQLDFNEPVDSSTIGVEDLIVTQGTVTDAVAVGTDSVQYTLGGVTEEGRLDFELVAGALADVFGNIGAGYDGHANLDVDSWPFPVPLQPLEPFGTLAGQGTRLGTIAQTSDTDTFTIDLDANQLVTWVVTPATNLQPRLEWRDPDDVLIGAHSASTPGRGAYLQSVDTTTSGTYQLTVLAEGDSTGDYTLSLFRNAAIELEDLEAQPNGQVGSAESIDGSFLSVPGNGSLANVYGSLPSDLETALFHESFDDSSHQFTVDNGFGSGGGLWHHSTGRQSDGLEHHTAQSLYFGTGETDTTGGTYASAGAVGGIAWSPQIMLPDEDQLKFRFAYYLEREADSQWDVAEVLLELDGQVHTLLSSEDGSLTPTDGSWSVITADVSAFRGRDVPVAFAFDTYDGTQNDHEGWFIDDVALLAPAEDNRDLFSFSMQQDETVTIAVNALGDSAVAIELLDPSGTPLARGGGNYNLSSAVHQYGASQSGLHYARVTGNGEYTLLVTRNLDFDREHNNSVLSAQSLEASSVLGYLYDSPAGNDGGGAAAPSGGTQVDADFLAGRLLVRFAEDVSDVERAAFIDARNATVIMDLPIIHGALVELAASDTDVLAAAANWSAYGQVVYAEPDYEVHIQATLPDDPLIGDLWALNNEGQTGGTPNADIDAVEAWDLTTGSNEIVVAVIDTGVDYTHPDLVDNMWTNASECPAGIGNCVADGIDNDSNGYVDDFHGIDWAYGDSDPMDGQGHGTHVAGTIGAVGNNGLGVAGINWDVQLMPLKFLSDFGSGSISGAIAAIDYMTHMKIDYGVNLVVSNNSWTGGGFTEALQDAIGASIDAGILFVAGAGNDAGNNDALPAYPASYPLDGIVAVAATDHNDHLAWFSNYGATSVDLAAPGVNILSTSPGNSYRTLSGTSMASPHVAGAAALLAAAAPGATPHELKVALLGGVDPAGALTEKTLTEGRLNVVQSLLEMGDPGDFFALPVAAGDTLIMTTSTPGSDNLLDPKLVVYDANGGVLAADDNGATDERNAWLSYTTSETTTLYAAVQAAHGSGTYLLEISGSTGMSADPQIIGSAPSDGDVHVGTLHEVQVEFESAVLLSSLSASDLKIDGLPAATIRSVPRPNVVVFGIPPLNHGSHALQIDAGAIVDLVGRPFGALQSSFEVDVHSHPVATEDLVAHWTFDEGSGTIAHDTSPFGSDHQATLEGLVQWTTYGRGNSVLLDDDGSFIDVGDASDINTQDQRDRTFSVWFYATDSEVSSRKQVIIEEGGTIRGLNIYLHAGSLYVGGWNEPWNESGWSGTFLSTSQVTTGQWHHVALVLNGDRTLENDALTGYLDGVAFGSGPASRLWGHTGDTGIGRIDGAYENPQATTKFHTGDVSTDGHDFDGLLDDLRIYNRVLSPAEVQALAAQEMVEPFRLTLAFDQDWIYEDGQSTVTIGRSGQVDEALDVALHNSLPVDVFVPDTVTIPAGQSEATFTVDGIDDLFPDGFEEVTITATAVGYIKGEGVLQIVDNEPAEQALVAFWDFHTGGGTTALDVSPEGSDNSGTLVNNTHRVDFGVSRAVQLDGDGDFIAIPDSDDLNLNTTTERTVGLWFYASDATIADRKQVLYEEGGTLRGLNIYLHDGELFVGGWNTSTNESGWSGTFLRTSQIESNRWHYVTLVLDGGPTLETGALHAWLDGVEFGVGEGSQLWPRAGDIGIGQVTGVWEGAESTTRFHTGVAPTDGDAFEGLIDEVRVYNRALGDPEIDVLANQPLVTPQRLSIQLSESAVWESAGATMATLVRIGDTTGTLQVDLASSNESVATLPPNVTLAAGEESTTFWISVPDDTQSDGNGTTVLTAFAAGFLGADAELTVWDDEPAEQGLIAYWALNEGSGNVAVDSSPYGLDHAGALQGDTAWYSYGLGGSLLLDGAGDYVSVPDSADLNTGTVSQRTIAAWIYVDDATPTAHKQVVYEQGGSNRGLNIYVHDGNLYVGGWNTITSESGWAGSFLSTDVIESGRWHHVALVLDGGPAVTSGALRGYLDGQEFAVGAGSQVWGHIGDIGIGQATEIADSSIGTTRFHSGDAGSVDGHGLAGMLDEVKVYDRALTSSEIAVLAQQDLTEPVFLSVDIATDSVWENGAPLSGIVARTGDTTESLVVSISTSDAGVLAVPATVTILAGQMEADFFVTPMDDALANGTRAITIEAAADNYESGQDSLEVWDNEPSQHDLIAYWPLNDGSGTLVDDLSPDGLDHDGSLQGDASWNPFGNAGALALDGDGDFVAVPDAADVNAATTTRRTVAAWFYVDEKSTSDRKQVIFDEGGTSRGMNIYVHDGRLYVGGWNTPTTESGWEGSFLSTDAISSGQWHHVTLVLDAGQQITADALRGYLDGQEFGVGSGSQIWSHVGDMGIGQATERTTPSSGITKFHDEDGGETDGHGLSGMVDEVRIYDRVLRPHEIHVLAGQTMSDPAWLQLSLFDTAIDETDGTTLATVTRSGNIDEAVEISMDVGDSGRVTGPETVTIAAGEPATTFAIATVNNPYFDFSSQVAITVSATGYYEAGSELTVTDDEQLLVNDVAIDVTNQWTPVTLPQSYRSMVVIATPNYSNSNVPLVPRIRNAGGDSFELRVDRTDGSTAGVPGINVHYLVVEEGVYSADEHGVTMEAVKFDATITDRQYSWNGHVRTYANSYTQPVVVGQVMTYNDPDFSAFWSRGTAANSPPTATTLRVGKHVGKDNDTTRATEQLGYVVIEGGSGTVDGIAYVAALGAETIQGMDNNPPFSYSLSGLSAASTAVASQSGMNGNHGGWAVLYHNNPVTAAGISLAIDEDQATTLERAHLAEHVAYLVFEDSALHLGASSHAGDQAAELTHDAVQPILAYAIQLWKQASPEAAINGNLDDVTVSIVDLPGGQVGRVEGNEILLDATAAHVGWFVDPTPRGNTEYDEVADELVALSTGPAADHVDLLTVLAHELGHILHLNHAHDAQSLMSEQLPAGIRRLPQSDGGALVDQAIDEMQSELEQWDISFLRKFPYPR